MIKTDLVRAIAFNLNDLIADTTPSTVTGSSVDANVLIHPTETALRGANFYIYSGAGTGQERVVGSFNPASRRLVFPQVFGSVPSINSNFFLFESFRKVEYDNAIERMMGVARTKHLETRVATLQIVATQYQYIVPSGFQFISTLRLVPSGHTDYQVDDEVARVFEFAPRYWRIERNAVGTPVIILDPRKVDLDDFDNEWVNVIGQVKPASLGTDNATISTELEEFVIAGASALLASTKIKENEKAWYSRFQMFKQDADRLEASVFTHVFGKKVD